MVNFVILTPGRSGSTHLCRTLKNHSQIVVEEEIFNRAFTGEGSFTYFMNNSILRRSAGYFFNREKTTPLRINIPIRYFIYSFLLQKINITDKSYGFKLTLDQFEAYPHLKDILTELNFTIIYITRHDKLKMVLSLLKSRKTGIYDSHQSNEMSLTTRMYFDPNLVEFVYKKIVQDEKKVLNLFKTQSTIIIYYEDLFQDYNKHLKQISSILSVRHKSIALSNLKKLNSDDLEDWVSNIEELKRKIRLLNTNEIL